MYPATTAGLEWETDPGSKERLDDRLLADIDRPDLLPLVEFVLERLFEQRVTHGDNMFLTFAAWDGSMERSTPPRSRRSRRSRRRIALHSRASCACLSAIRPPRLGQGTRAPCSAACCSRRRHSKNRRGG